MCGVSSAQAMLSFTKVVAPFGNWTYPPTAPPVRSVAAADGVA